MFDDFIAGLAGIILKRYIKKKNYSEVNFGDFFTKSKTVIIIMPHDDTEFHQALEVVDYLIEHNKSIRLFLPEEKLNLLNRNTENAVTFRQEDISKLGLPNKTFRNKLETLQFDIVIDLNRSDNLFYRAVSNYFNSKIRVGFKKDRSDLYYNFQVPERINNENSYRNLLNSFKMF